MAPIHDAAYDGDVEPLRRELGRGIPPDARDIHGTTPLFCAVMNNHTDCVRLLLQAGADPNTNRGTRTTPWFKALHMAAHNGSADVIRMLLEAGATVNPRTDTSWTAIDYVLENHACVYPILLRAGSELPEDRPYRPLREDPYLSRILDAGSFKNYERAHSEALTRTLSPKLAHLLPPELVRKVVEFYLHAGFYPFTAAKAPATAPAA